MKFFVFFYIFLFFTFAETKIGKVKIVATTGILADALQSIFAPYMEVDTLMRAGIDPHIYKPSPSALKKIDQAEVLVYHGLHLEGNMQRVFTSLSPYKLVISAASFLDPHRLILLGAQKDSFDPHIWMDIPLWLEALEGMVQKIYLLDLVHRSFYQEKFALYREKLLALDEKNKTLLNEIPQNQRILITTHDGFSYFGRHYGYQVLALQGVSTQADFGLKKLMELADFIIENNIKAIFLESTVPKKAFQSIQEAVEKAGKKLDLVGVLYTDALGTEQAKTYFEMQEFNVNLIYKALR